MTAFLCRHPRLDIRAVLDGGDKPLGGGVPPRARLWLLESAECAELPLLGVGTPHRDIDPREVFKRAKGVRNAEGAG